MLVTHVRRSTCAPRAGTERAACHSHSRHSNGRGDRISRTSARRPTMKIGLFAMGTNRMAGGALLRSVAANAERLGVATLWVPEHVVLIDQYASKYPYSLDGQLPGTTSAPILDPFLALTCMASATSKIRLATGICLVD